MAYHGMSSEEISYPVARLPRDVDRSDGSQVAEVTLEGVLVHLGAEGSHVDSRHQAHG